MKIIKCIAEKIKEETQDAEAYADLAMEWKKEEPETADLFEELSEKEMGHAEKLHGKVTELIENYKAENGEPPAGMMALYEYMHEQNVQDAMRVKIKQGMYKA